MHFKQIVLFLLFGVSFGDALKVLIYQIAFSNSHLPFSGAMADALVDKGHTVDKLIVVYNPNVKTNGSTRLRNVYRVGVDDNPFMKSDHLVDPFTYTTFSRRDARSIKTRLVFCQSEFLQTSTCRFVEYNFCYLCLFFDTFRLIISNFMKQETKFPQECKSDDNRVKLQAEKYDSLLFAPFDFCAFALNHVLKIPSLNAYSVLAQDCFIGFKLGLPVFSSYVPHVFDGRVQPRNKPFWDRLQSFIYMADYEYDEMGLGVEEYKYLRNMFPDFPTVTEMYKKVNYIFINTNELLDIPQPSFSRIKYLGGIAMKPNDGKLTEEG
ncbi:UDP-glucuronosyltransferase [Aphelenchoides bicaudatus]|nr:UDP-glucuronosyltransferase [Aphelenchoides bicaudatus]